MTYHTIEIQETLTKISFALQRRLLNANNNDPASCFQSVSISARRKAATAADIFAEFWLKEQIVSKLRHTNPLIVGEESSSASMENAASHDGLVYLVDAVDGTELFRYGWNDWCTAIVVYKPKLQTIVSAVVAFPTGVAYCASRGQVRRCFMQNGRLESRAVSGPSGAKECAGMALCGYPHRRFSSLRNALATWLPASRGEIAPDLFVVGGHSALVKTVDGDAPLDAVLEPQGQLLHDMAAGAYIAREGGATVIGPGGESLQLESLLCCGDLSRRVSYIAAGSKKLAEQLRCRVFNQMIAQPKAA